MSEWISVDDSLPNNGGFYLVTVATDDGECVRILEFLPSRKHWIDEGEPTFCHSYYFEVTHWAECPEPAGATS
jgi:hypothetical protein